MAFILAIRSHVTVPNVPLYVVTIDSTLEDNIRENLSLVPEKNRTFFFERFKIRTLHTLRSENILKQSQMVRKYTKVIGPRKMHKTVKIPSTGFPRYIRGGYVLEKSSSANTKTTVSSLNKMK